MFNFRAEPDQSLLTVTRLGFWTLDTVADYEAALRRELSILAMGGGPVACIVDVRNTAVQSQGVADALRAVIERLGTLIASRTAVVASGGLSKLQARRVAHDNTRIFTSMVLARDWALGREETKPLGFRTTA